MFKICFPRFRQFKFSLLNLKFASNNCWMFYVIAFSSLLPPPRPKNWGFMGEKLGFYGGKILGVCGKNWAVFPRPRNFGGMVEKLGGFPRPRNWVFYRGKNWEVLGPKILRVWGKNRAVFLGRKILGVWGKNWAVFLSRKILFVMAEKFGGFYGPKNLLGIGKGFFVTKVSVFLAFLQA